MSPTVDTTAYREDFTIEVNRMPGTKCMWRWVLWQGPSRRAEYLDSPYAPRGDYPGQYIHGDAFGSAPSKRLALFFARRQARSWANYRADVAALHVETWHFSMERDEGDVA